MASQTPWTRRFVLLWMWALLAPQLTLAGGAPRPPAPGGTWRALVVGVSDTPSRAATLQSRGQRPLTQAAADARAVARVLDERYAFDVTVLVDRDATRERILAEVDALVERGGGQDHLLLYFSGHGILTGGMNYLIGWGEGATDPSSSDDEVATAYGVWDRELIRRFAQGGKSSHRLLILDNCHAGDALNAERYLAHKGGEEESIVQLSLWMAQPSEQTVVATLPGQDALAGSAKWGGLSFFTYHLVHQLSVNTADYISIDLVFERVATAMSLDAVGGARQSPMLGSLQGVERAGRFVFKRAGAAPLPSARPPLRGDETPKGQGASPTHPQVSEGSGLRCAEQDVRCQTLRRIGGGMIAGAVVALGTGAPMWALSPTISGRDYSLSSEVVPSRQFGMVLSFTGAGVGVGGCVLLGWSGLF